MLNLGLLPIDLANGMVICACMPLSVTLVIVLTKSAEGNEAAAILNAAFGSLLGVFVSPLLILAYIGIHADIDMATVFFKLVLRVLVPIAVGQVLLKFSTTAIEFVKKYKKHFKTCQEWALVFVVYTVFCKTFQNDIEVTIQDVLWMAICQCFLLVGVMILAWYSLELLFRDDPRLRVTGLFACTQKSVAFGIPLINALYDNDPRIGMFTLPLLIWHPAQLIIGSALAPRLAEGVEQQLEIFLGIPDGSTRRRVERVSFFQRPKVAQPASFNAFEFSELSEDLGLVDEEKESVRVY
jgi:sodium/bile acid cotransporter 7